MSAPKRKFLCDVVADLATMTVLIEFRDIGETGDAFSMEAPAAHQVARKIVEAADSIDALRRMQ